MRHLLPEGEAHANPFAPGEGWGIREKHNSARFEKY
jgi:hypothetical protein